MSQGGGANNHKEDENTVTGTQSKAEGHKVTGRGFSHRARVQLQGGVHRVTW